jgi:multiple antibiotic resistance protein
MEAAARSLLLILSALFPIVNPLGSSPIFLLLTRDYSPESRRSLSRRIATNSFFLLSGSYLIGAHVLAFFGISLPVVQVGGGLVVISAGWMMLKRGDDEDRSEVRRDLTSEDVKRRAFYPYTMPLTVGPGSISVAVTLGANLAQPHHASLVGIAAALVACLLLALSIFVCYAFADRLARFLGATAMTVIVRLSSFLLVCIGVQIVWNGVSALLSTVPLQVR